MTDDNGQPIRNQARVIEQRGQWMLLYEGGVYGGHQFVIEKVPHRIQLYPGISLEEAKRRLAEAVENDYE